MKSTALAGCVLLAACVGAQHETGSTDSGSNVPADSGESPVDSGEAESTACSMPTAAESQTTSEIAVEGVQREYRLSVPDADSGVTLPIVMAFHGGNEGHHSFPQQNSFEALVQEQGVIMVYPHAKLVLPNEGAWQLNTSDSSTQDIDFIEALIDELSTNYCVDSNRIYATGYSLGSMFTYELACHLNDRFAAIASMAGTMPVEPISCVMQDNVPIMHLHGRNDAIISYDREWDWKEWDSVGTMMNILGLIEYWSEQYSCQEESETETGSVTHLVHDACDDDVRVEHYSLAGGHEWPNTISGVSTHEVVWNFVSAFSKP